MASLILVRTQERIDLKHEALAILEKPQAQRSAAEEKRLVAIEARMPLVDADLRQLAALQEEERRQGGEAYRPRGDAAIVTRATGRTYREMFPHVQLDAGGFKGSEEFIAVLHGGLADPRLLAIQNTQQDSTGGFSVPTQLRAAWLDGSLEGEIVRPRADVWPMASSSIEAPGFDDGNHSDTLYGGFSGGWANEGSDLTLEEVKLRMIRLQARKLGILARVSNELVADGISFDAQLGTAIVKAIGWFADRAFFNGNGANAPLGILNSSATISVAKETGQAAATIVYPNLTKMFSRMLPASIGNSVWVANSTTIPELLSLTMAIGVAGSHIPVLSESGGKWTLLTRPVIFTEKVPTLGSKGDIGLYDFSQYAVGLRADMQLAKSAHAGFASDTSYYRAILRVDGQPKLSAPVTPKNGSTQSPFIVLDPRA